MITFLKMLIQRLYIPYHTKSDGIAVDNEEKA